MVFHRRQFTQPHSLIPFILRFVSFAILKHSNHIRLLDPRRTHTPTSPSFRPKRFRNYACRSIREYVSRRYPIIPHFENSIHGYHTVVCFCEFRHTTNHHDAIIFSAPPIERSALFALLTNRRIEFIGNASVALKYNVNKSASGLSSQSFDCCSTSANF